MGFFDTFLGRNPSLVNAEPNFAPVVVDVPPLLTHTPGGYGALMSIDYAACVQTKARSMASLPFTVVYESSTRRENLRNHPLAKLLNGMANEEMSAASLMSWTVNRRDTFGNAYWFVEWVGAQPRAVYPITSSVTHDFDASAPVGYRTRYYVAPGDDHVAPGWYFSHEVVNIPTHVTKDGIKGMSLAQLAADELGLSIDLEKFYHSMLKNGNHQLGHVELPAGHYKAEDKEALENAIRAKSGVQNAGRAPIFGYGAKWVTDQQTMKDASVIEQQQWVLKQVCRACNVPPWKVYEDNTTYYGGQQQRIDYVTDTIVPDVRVVEMALQPVLDACTPKNCRAKFKVNGLMRGDDESRTQYYRELAYLGVLTRSDVRDLEDLEPIGGLDAPLFPLNYGTVDTETGEVTVYSSKDEPTATADGNQEGVTNVSNSK